MTSLLRATGALGLALLLPLTACGAGSPHTQASSTVSATTARPSPAGLGTLWSTAVRRLDRGTSYHVNNTAAGALIVENGVVFASPAGTYETYHFFSGSSSTLQTIIRRPGAYYVQEKQTGVASPADTGRCWLRTRTDGSPVVAALRVLDDATPVRRTHHGTLVVAKAPLADVLYADGSHFSHDLGITDSGAGRVRIEAQLDRGAIISWSAADADIIRAGLKAGGTRDAYLESYRKAGQVGHVIAAFYDLDDGPVQQVERPAHAVTYDDLDRIRSTPACHAGP